MLLVIDVGNTHTVFGVYKGTILTHHFRLSTDSSRTSDEYGVLLRELLLDVDIAFRDISAAALASVVPPATGVFHHMCVSRLGFAPLVVEPGVKTGMPILYEHPRDVGADRIVNAVAGYESQRHVDGGPRGLIIVDFGTATTFDVVTPKGEYLGGAIAPGVGISMEALFARASKLPRVDFVVPRSSIGRSTVTSMQAGIFFGYVALVDGMLERMRGELDFAPAVIGTGGIAPLIAPASQRIDTVNDLLTLEGLRIVHGRNQ